MVLGGGWYDSNQHIYVKVTLAQDRLTVSNRTQEDETRKEINVNIENRLRFSVKLIKAEYSMWNKTEEYLQDRPETPWLDLIEFPLGANSSGDNILQSSGLIRGNGMVGCQIGIVYCNAMLRHGDCELNFYTQTVTGLTEMFPGCSSLSCLVSECPASAEPQHFCESILGRGVISQPGYPRQLSSNYITFSRRSPCHPAQHFSRPSVLHSHWSRAS